LGRWRRARNCSAAATSSSNASHHSFHSGSSAIFAPIGLSRRPAVGTQTRLHDGRRARKGAARAPAHASRWGSLLECPRQPRRVTQDSAFRDGRSGRIDLSRGGAFGDHSSMTPQAIASVRGTKWATERTREIGLRMPSGHADYMCYCSFSPKPSFSASAAGLPALSWAWHFPRRCPCCSAGPHRCGTVFDTCHNGRGLSNHPGR
jgi:hypothetical protein